MAKPNPSSPVSGQRVPRRTTDPRRQLVAQLCPEWAVDSLFFYQPFEGGYRNRNYRFEYDQQAYVLRVPGHASDIDRATESTVLECINRGFDSEPTPQAGAKSVGLRCLIPEIVGFDQSSGAMISRFCPWPLLADSEAIDGAQLGRYLALLHDTLDALTDQLRPLLEPQPRTHERIITDLERASAPQSMIRQIRALAEADAALNLTLETHPLNREQISHQDLNPWNLLIDSGHGSHKPLTDTKMGSANHTLGESSHAVATTALNWLTLDWETLGLASPLFDLVTLVEGYALARGDGAVAQERLCSSACATYAAARARQHSQDQYEHARRLFYWREYAWAAAQQAQGNRLPAIATQHQHYARLLTQLGFAVR